MKDYRRRYGIMLEDSEINQIAADAKVNEESFDRLYRIYQYFRHRYAIKYYFPHESYEEKLQEVNIFFWLVVRDYNPNRGVDFGAFAHFVTRRRLITKLRTTWRIKNRFNRSCLSLEQKIFDSDGPGKELGDLIADSQEGPMDDETREAFWDYLKKHLTELELKCAIMFYLQGYKYRDISKECEVSEKGVDNALTRVKRKMKLHKTELLDLIRR